MGVAIEDLTTGDHFFLHEDEVFAQASSIKITVLANLYLQAQQGKLKLTDLYTVQSSDLVPDSDIMGGLTPGVTRITLRDLATMMVAVSDNSATNVLIDRVGMQNVNAMLDSLGLTHTRLRRKMMDLEAAKQGRENISTPREMMTLARRHLSRKAAEQRIDRRFLQSPEHEQGFLDSPRPSGRSEDRQQARRTRSRAQRFRHCLCRRPSLRDLCDDVVSSNERDGEEAISKVSLAAWRMFDRLSRATEYGRVVSPGNGAR